MANYHVVSMSHIDMAFVMRKEAHAEMLEILLERIINVLERNPGIHFALEQAAHYRNLKERRPDLFQKVRELLKEGRLEFMGGMATTAETNFPNGECLVRNQGMGLRWLEENLDVHPHSGWLVDTFGLNPQVPQIMKQFGFEHLHANRFGGNKRYDIFQAEGLDGSKVVIIGCDSASINVLPETQSFIFCRSWGDVDVLFRKADRLQGELPKLVTYYIENEEVFSEYYLKLTKERNVEGNWLHSTYKEYRDELINSGYEPPVVKDDLNPEFTGTFALRSPIKVGNRKSEIALLNAEKWQALLMSGNSNTLEDCWWDLFHCQFHDAFTGSHEDITYNDLLKRFDRVQRKTLKIQKEALQLQEDEYSIVCCNSLPWDREEWVEMDAVGRSIAVYDEGEKVPQSRQGNKLFFWAKIPAGGIKSFEIRNVEGSNESIQTGQKEIANEYLKLVLDERTGIEHLKDTQGNCYISQAGNFLVAEEDRGGMQIERCEGNEIYAATGEVNIEEAVSDAMGERIVMCGEFPIMRWNKGNRLSWKAEFSLRKGEKQLRLKLTLDWVGDTTRIRLKLPFTREGRDFYNEVPFGVTRREAYRNLPTAKGEWPVQRFAALEDGKMGIALINKGVAGVEQEGSMLAATLIRAYGDGPDAWVKPTPLSSQNGTQTFEFVIAPYEGHYRDASILQLAQEYNQEIQVFKGRSELCDIEKSFFKLHGKGLVLSAIKKAWDGTGELIVRIYESEGRNTLGQLTISGIRAVWLSDMKEDKKEELIRHNDKIELEFKPFEIKTIRLVANNS